jgi:hypothetical protein
MDTKEAMDYVEMSDKDDKDYQIASSGCITPEWTLEDEKRIRNRMDWRIVPTVFVLYLLCFIDR